jgi:hypothetical protein
VSDGATESTPSAVTKRAQWYLRFYPPVWRDRYGDEFTEHMESELLEHPSDPSRTLNILFHGVLTRFALQRLLRRTMEAVLAAAITTTVVLAIVAAQHVAPALSLTSGDNSGSGSVGIPTTASQVNDLSFVFSSKTRASIFITSISLLGLPGLKTPKLVGVDLERRPSDLANMGGWPIVPPKSSFITVKDLVPAINRIETLAHVNTIWVALRTPNVGSAYVISGLAVTYVHLGSTHTVVLRQPGFADEICVVPNGAKLDLQPCARQIALAAGESSYADSVLSPSRPIREALAVGNAASTFAFYNHRAARISDVRRWAARLFPVRSTHGVLRVAVINDRQHLWSFEEKSGANNTSVRVCTTPGTYTTSKEIYGPSQGMSPPTKAACPATASR